MVHIAGWQATGKKRLSAILRIALAPLALLLILVSVTRAEPQYQEDFNGSSLGAGWTAWDGYREQFPGDTANSAVFAMTGTHLSISFRSGVEHNMWPLTHAQVTRPYLGSGVYETKVDAAMTGDQQFGLTFQKDHSTFMKFMLFSYADGRYRGYVERFALVNGTVARSTVFEADIPVALPANGPHYARVVVEDNVNPALRRWKFDWSADGASWSELVSAVFETSAATENAGAIQQVGVFAGMHYSFPAFEARFDYFRYYDSLANAPLSRPDNLVARAGDQRVDLAWGAVPYATSYNIYSIPVSGGAPTLLGTSSQTSFARTGLTNGAAYRFAVAGVRSGVAGALAEVTAVPHASALAGLPTSGLLLALSAPELAYGQAHNSAVTAWTNAVGPWSTALGTGSRAPTLVHSAIGGQAAVRFDGVDDHLTLPGGFDNFSAGMSLYLVMRPGAHTTSAKVLLLGNGVAAQNVGFGLLANNSSLQYFTNSSWGEYGWFATPGGATVGEAALVAVHQNGGAADSSTYAEITRNGVALLGQNVFAPPVAARSLNYIAKSYFDEAMFKGDIAEVLLYNRKLTAAENAAVQSYVASRYGLAIAGSTPPPDAPTSVTATAGDGSVSVNWGAVSGATGYRVYRGTTSGGPYTEIASTTAASYVNSGLANGTTYYFVVRAFNANAESVNSQQVAATPSAPAALVPPGGVAATAGDRRVWLTWNAVSGASGYRVLRGTAPGGPYTLIASPTSTDYTNTGLTNGRTYYYVVRAYSSVGESPNSQQVSATPSAPASLAPPAGVSATAGNGSVSLTWAAVSGVTGYRVYRSTVSGGSYSLIASPASTSYTNTGLTNGTTYYYVVRAYNSVTQSPNSQQVSATPSAPASLAPPAGLSATAGNASVSLTWAAVSGVTGYRVYRSVVSGGPYTLIASPTSTSYTNTGLTNGTTYYYVVRAYNSVTESSNSLQISATPTAPLPSPDPALPAAGRLLVLDAQVAAQQFANGAAVTTWSDISGNTSHAVAAGTAAPVLVTNAINGRAVLRFDGVDDYMTLPSGFQDFTAGMSMYVVMRPSAVPAFSFKILALGNGPGQQNIGLARGVDGPGLLFWNSNAAGEYSWFASPAGLVAGETSLVTVLQNSGTVGSSSYAELAKNGVTLAGQNVFVPPVAARTVNYIAKSYWGNEGPFQGDIAEIIVYNRKLSAAEHAAVKAYIANKYALSVAP